MTDAIVPNGSSSELASPIEIIMSKYREVAVVILKHTDETDIHQWVEPIERVQELLETGGYDSNVDGGFFEVDSDRQILVQLSTKEAIKRSKEGAKVITLGPICYVIAAKEGPLPPGFEGRFLPESTGADEH